LPDNHQRGSFSEVIENSLFSGEQAPHLYFASLKLLQGQTWEHKIKIGIIPPTRQTRQRSNFIPGFFSGENSLFLDRRKETATRRARLSPIVKNTTSKSVLFYVEQKLIYREGNDL
jgi:hypothetical protein